MFLFIFLLNLLLSGFYLHSRLFFSFLAWFFVFYFFLPKLVFCFINMLGLKSFHSTLIFSLAQIATSVFIRTFLPYCQITFYSIFYSVIYRLHSFSYLIWLCSMGFIFRFPLLLLFRLPIFLKTLKCIYSLCFFNCWQISTCASILLFWLWFGFVGFFFGFVRFYSWFI